MTHRMRSTLLSMILGAIFMAGPFIFAEPIMGYYRFPALHGDVIVFSAEGDLWTVDAGGGVARRLTTHPGEESHPAVSPDGKILAFTATYEGPSEVYTMPLEGGVPTRWTYEADASTVVGFTPDGRLLYTTRAFSTLPNPQLASLDIKTGKTTLLPLSQASDGSYDGSLRTLYFARPGFHNNNTKRYQGGTARNIWKYSEAAAEAVNLTADFAGENFAPMWWDNRVYYVCDRDGTWNIWSMDPEGKDLKQHTFHSGWEVKSPSLDRGRIIYQLGADLHVVDLKSGDDAVVPITLASDFDQLREKWVTDPLKYLTTADIHPEGERIVLTTRGRVFVASVKEGRLVRASYKEGVRYRDAVFMPDGKSLLALSDESGEFEFVQMAADGVGAEENLTDNGTILRFRGVPSPDGKRIAFTDKNNDFWLMDSDGNNQKKISSIREVYDIAWSPDSLWLTYNQRAFNSFVQIHLYSLETGKQVPLTTDRINSKSPAWSPDGRFLYFLSDRNLRSVVGSPWGTRQPEPFFNAPFKIYALSLEKGAVSPFKPDTELSASAEESKRIVSKAASGPVKIDLEGIQGRIREVPVAPGNYSHLQANETALFWVESGQEYNAPAALNAVKISNRDIEVAVVMEGIRDYDMSLNRKKLMILKGNDFYVFDAAPRKANDLAKAKVDLENFIFSMDVREDFRQIFIDAWRMERDYFWDPGMHGLDWTALRDKYLPLVDRVTTRLELNDLIGELMGELSALHVSVRGGDLRQGQDQIRVAGLGARLMRDDAVGGYRIDYIYRSDPDYPEELSPLADPDLDVQEGDIILSINGRNTLSVRHPNALLRNQAGEQVLLVIRSGKDGTERRVVVVPIENESGLRYSDWEYTRRLKVEKEGKGDIGYVHLRAMGGGNITEWYRNFYPVFNRKGLIIDVRHNRGGNIDAFILEKLIRKAWFFWKDRVGRPTWNMHYAFRGHMVVLCDENTASDGEAFAEGFRRLGLGKVIGTRTWGGEIWLGSSNRLTDGGLARAPQTGVYGPERVWLIEGHGVDPDIVVDNLPHATFKGEDTQLDAALAYLKDKIEKEPVEVPEPPPYPDKSFKRD